MTKDERLQIENEARIAIGNKFNCRPVRKVLQLGPKARRHEFDIYAEGVVIGGASTSTLETTKGNPNTGSRDRAAAEVLWLTLWSGPEQRVHVLTDASLAGWLVNHFSGAGFMNPIYIYRHNMETEALDHIGTL